VASVFWATRARGQRQLPEGSLLPVLGEAESIQAHIRVLRQKARQAFTPTAAWCDDAMQCLDHHGLRIKTRRVLKLSRQVPGCNRFDGVDAIPQPLMVCRQIAHIGQRVQPQPQHAAIKAERLGKGRRP